MRTAASTTSLPLQRSPWAVAALEAVQAWLLIAAAALLLGFAGWFWLQAGDVPVSALLSNAATLIALSFGMPVEMLDASFTLFSPLLALIPSLLLYRAARRTAEALTVNAMRGARGTGPVCAAAATLLGCSALMLAGIGALMEPAALLEPVPAIRAFMLIALVVGGGLMARLSRLGEAPTPRRTILAFLEARAGAARAESIRAGLLAARDLLLGALLLAMAGLASALWLNWDAVSAVHGAYDLDLAGTFGLTALQVAFGTVALSWSLAWLTGAGFAVGTDTMYHFAVVEAGPVPALPALAALPLEPQPWGWVVPALGLAAGAILGWLRLARHDAGATGLLALAGAVFLAGAVIGLLGAGSLGPGRLAELGPNPLLLGAALTLPVTVGASLVVLAHRRRSSIASGFTALQQGAGERREQVREALKARLR